MNRNRKDPVNKRIGKIATKAFRSAHKEAMQSGEKVVFAKEGHLCEYNPGKQTSKRIKPLPQRVSIKEEYIVL